MSDPKCECQRVRAFRRTLLERPERLLQDAAVDLDPPVAELDKRRALIQKKTNFFRSNGFTRDANGQLEIV